MKNNSKGGRPANNASAEFDLNSMAAKRPKKRSRVNVKRVVLNVVAVLLIICSVTYILGIGYLENRPFDGGENITPTDSYGEISKSEHEDCKYFLVVGLDESEDLTDVILVGCFDLKKQKLNFMQIQRDTYVGEDVPTGKINAVYGYPREGETGMNALIRKINSHFGLPIDYSIAINLPAFNKIVDALGGIDIDVPVTISYNGITVYEGQQTLNGKQAETFMRVRSSYAKGDAGRVEVQRLFYVALFKRLMTMNAADMLSVYNACKDDIKTNMSWDEILTYANEAKKLTMDSVEINPMPGESYFNDYNGRWYYSVHLEKLLDLLNEKFDPYGMPITAEDIFIEEQVNTNIEGIDMGGTLTQIDKGEMGEAVIDDEDDESDEDDYAE